MSFVHLHNHSHYSTLDGLSKPKDMVKRAIELNQPAMAITDHGNLMGAIDFYQEAKKAGIKPIIGSEFYLAENMKSREKGEGKYHLVLLAKNETGYKNLIALSTEANLYGFYSKPRIDFEILKKHCEGLIGLSACIAGEIPSYIIDGDLEKAKETALKYKALFGKENFYLEIQHHPDIKEQAKVNKELIKMSKELGIGLVATNDAHYVSKDDAIIQDALICINTNKLLNEREGRMCMMDGNYSILSTEEMVKNFKDIPEAIENTVKISEMCELEIKFGQKLMPKFECPESMGEDEYLKSLCADGLNSRYGIIIRAGEYVLSESSHEKKLPLPLDEIVSRLEFELETVNSMGFPGYFLIVQDFVNWAKSNGILVGPGRGSAAGSLISYLTGITNVDPLKHGLLFERFLNPDRISMPDIDIDFQDDKRDQVLEYVRNKYGESNVSQVVTYQTMGAKNSIRDIGRVMNIPLDDVNKICNMISWRVGTTIESSLKEKEFKKFYDDNPQFKDLIDMANRIEGTIRGTGTHACAVIISGVPVCEIVPLQYPPREKEIIITQYEGPQLDKIGLLKMDFLGLRNLTIISEALESIKKRTGKDLDIDRIPFDDKKTFNLYSKGITDGIFQFESDGMKKYLKDLKPNKFEYLVAMNALYRPGPMDKIPDFIRRRHGKEKVEYDHPLMEKYLKDTYGITVYQEQVMLLSRELAGYTRGDSDTLRKAMAKKDKKLLPALKKKFYDGCKANPKFIEGCVQMKKEADKVIEEIWDGWEKFGDYAFNLSHSVCYAYVSYQTAYLKANYPVEFMSAMLNSVRDKSEDVLKYIEECNNLGIKIVRPDVNTSYNNFAPTKDGSIAFGLQAIKNVGAKAIESIIEMRESGGIYRSIYDFLERVDISKANRRTIEHLAKAGALDSLGHPRAQIVESLETLLPHYQQAASQKNDWGMSLFGESSDEEITVDHLPLADVAEWDKSVLLENEKELIGLYVSGHPLDEYKELIQSFSTSKKIEADNFVQDEKFILGAKVKDIVKKFSKAGKDWANLILTTLHGEVELALFSQQYEKFKDIIKAGGVYFFRITVSKKDGEFRLYIDEVITYEQAQEKFRTNTKKIKISLTPAAMDEFTLKEFLEYIGKNKGEKDLYFRVITGSSSFVLKSDSYKVTGTVQFIKGLKEILGEDSIEFT
ncbi:MAG TPA: DNA polymerase III subunit alpha [Clostridiales bacterium]|nr:DNA polymerase III subunit alpha [Clostridiales bacterium]HQP68975.1 DNA polymerase III subunit alpha [Clostridiales bacterium]